MITNNSSTNVRQSGYLRADGFARVLPPLPLVPIQPVLAHIVTTIAKRHPGMFARLGNASKKRFLIDPRDLPFVLILEPDPDQPRLIAHNRGAEIAHDVYIAGSFMTLLRMIDSQTDSDALFFSRDLTVTGNSEAVVALRNALDDMDETLANDVAAAFGPLARPMRIVLDAANRFAGRNS